MDSVAEKAGNAMTKSEREVIGEILDLAEGNPGGYQVEGEYDPEDASPDNVGVLLASEIRRRCRKLLGLDPKEY